MSARMGLHGMLPMPPGTPARVLWEKYHLAVRPQVSKVCRQGFDPALMDWTRAQGTKLVGRWVDYALVKSAPENARIAQRVMAEYEPFARHLDYVEFANEEEQGKDDPKEWDRLMSACLTFMKLLDAANGLAGRAGPKACIANTSVGQPEIERWSRPSTLEVARYAAANGHVWGSHEYYKPRPWAGILHAHSEGRPDERALWDGPPPVKGWLMGRVTQVTEIMRANGIVGYKFLITESGRDNVPGQPGPGGGYLDEPVTPDGDYADFMGQYGRHLSALPCVGWVDYGYSHWEGWDKFDLALSPAMLDRFIEVQRPKETSMPAEGHLALLLKDALGDRFEDLRAQMADKPGFNDRDMALVEHYAIHHTAGPRNQSWKAIRDFHVNTKGWSGIGYHIGIRMGKVALLGDVTKARACVGNFNHKVVCICFTGDYTRTQVDPADLEVARIVVRVLDKYMGRKPLITGHGKLPGQSTECPGPLLAQHIPSLRSGVVSPPTSQPQFPKVRWAMEDSIRKLEAEGLLAEAKFIKDTYLIDAKRRAGEI